MRLRNQGAVGEVGEPCTLRSLEVLFELTTDVPGPQQGWSVSLEVMIRGMAVIWPHISTLLKFLCVIPGQCACQCHRVSLLDCVRLFVKGF